MVNSALACHQDVVQGYPSYHEQTCTIQQNVTHPLTIQDTATGDKSERFALPVIQLVEHIKQNHHAFCSWSVRIHTALQHRYIIAVLLDKVYFSTYAKMR